MRKVEMKEAKKVVGGALYKCRVCNYSAWSPVGIAEHEWAWHNIPRP